MGSRGHSRMGDIAPPWWWCCSSLIQRQVMLGVSPLCCQSHKGITSVDSAASASLLQSGGAIIHQTINKNNKQLLTVEISDYEINQKYK